MCKVYGNAFKRRLCPSSKKAVHRGNEGGVVFTIVEGIVEVLPLLFALGSLQALLRGLGLVGDGVSIHNTRIVNSVRPLSPKIPDQQVPLLLYLLLRRFPLALC